MTQKLHPYYLTFMSFVNLGFSTEVTSSREYQLQDMLKHNAKISTALKEVKAEKVKNLSLILSYHTICKVIYK